MSKKSITFAAAAATLMLAAGSGGAMAGGKHFRHHGLGLQFNSFNSIQHRHRRPILRLTLGAGGCGYLYDRWMYTGSFYWKSQFYQCKGWW